MNNKINNSVFVLGNSVFPAGTVRFDGADVVMKITPDDKICYDITLRFTFRILWAVYGKLNATQDSMALTEGWVGWNYQLGKPSVKGIAGLPNLPTGNPFAYYPCGWVDGFFQFFGAFHGMYIQDADLLAQLPAGLLPGLDYSLFYSGFKPDE